MTAGAVSTHDQVRRACRTVELDRLRGLAIAAMVVDHVTLVTAGPDALRLTVGRLALPVFFVLAGHLVGRFGWRHVATFVAGYLLTVLVPWIDNPNVLQGYALGAGLIALCRIFKVPPAVLGIVAVTLIANGVLTGGGYPLEALVALMVLGAMIPRAQLVAAGRPLPRLLEGPGRHALAIYVAHLLVLQLLLEVTS